MGMFDSVYLKCPKCKTDLEIQTKSGHCLLNSYELDEVPVEIARSLNGSTEKCYKCGHETTLEAVDEIPTHIKMKIKDWG